MANFYTDNNDLRIHLNHPLMKKIVELKEMGYRDKDKYDYAPQNFEDAMDNYDQVMEIIGDICGNVIAVNAESVDKEGPKVVDSHVVYAAGTKQNQDVMNRAGLIGLSLPRKYDGLNFPLVAFTMSAEMVARADAGFENIWGLQDCAETLHEFASDEIKDNFLPRFPKGATAAMSLTEPDAGSDLQAVQLRGSISASYDKETDTWYLNGVKRFITNGDADVSLVLARSEEGTADARGLSMFVYDKKDGGVVVRRIENKLGIKGSPTCELVYTNAPAKLVGDRKMGLIKYVMSLMNSARLGIGAQGVGICEAAYREAYNYALEREQFGKKIIEFPAVYELLAVMKAKTLASRSLLYETACFTDIYKLYGYAAHDRKLENDERQEAKAFQKLADIFTPLVKLFASEYANQNAYDGIQVLGGSGFMKDYPLERIYRDARITSIYEGTSQLQVVAAIRGVDNGGYIAQIKEYEKAQTPEELNDLKAILVKMAAEFEEAYNIAKKQENREFVDFHARRLVEMAGHVIMGHLMLINANKSEEYKVYSRVFIKRAQAENKNKFEYIAATDMKDVEAFRQN